MNIKTIKSINIIAFTAMVYLNYLSNALPINGHTPGELSDNFVNFFVPAGITFAIWGIIYGWLMVFVGAQIFSFFNQYLSKKIDPIIEKIGWLFIISCGLNMAWLLAWHYEYVLLSALIMILFLGILLLLFLNIGVGKTKVNKLEKWLSHAPFSIYVGWISIATIANITALLVHKQWAGFGLAPENWAKIMIIIGTLVTLFVIWRRNAIFYGFAVLWAFWGIHLKRNQIADAPSLEIDTLVYFCLGAVLFAILFKTKHWFDY
jgi:translocator protein